MMKEKKTADSESVEVLFAKIEALINELESGKEPLDLVLSKFKEAVALYRKASGILRDAKVKVTEIMKELEGEKDGELLNELVESDSTGQDGFTL
ncbi:MAG: exodeoxyribonuclease VII small subunit [Thermotogae bacterium]|jgi:exodeoxyribonuclease VII small subunit|nr:exodeoxyribonuclease VII small subunit [Thermotogota bacterium]